VWLHEAAAYQWYTLVADVRNCVVYSGGFDRVDGHNNRVFAGVFHPTDPNIFLTGGWDDTVQFWDCRVSSSVRLSTCFCHHLSSS